MARQTIAALAAACGLALILLPASVALADSAFDQVLKDYQSDGQIDPCAHSARGARKGAATAGVRALVDLPVGLVVLEHLVEHAVRQRSRAGQEDEREPAAGRTAARNASGVQ